MILKDTTNKLLTAGATLNLGYRNTSYNHMHQWEHICGKFYTSTLEAAFSRSKFLKTHAFHRLANITYFPYMPILS